MLSPQKPESTAEETQVETLPFCHLHTHTQFSVLQSTISIPKLIQETAAMNMPAVAITDIGNLMGAFHFVKAVNQAQSNHSKKVQAIPLNRLLELPLMYVQIISIDLIGMMVIKSF